VRYHNQRLIACALQFTQYFQHLNAGLRIKIPRWLIGQHNLGPIDQGISLPKPPTENFNSTSTLSLPPCSSQILTIMNSNVTQAFLLRNEDD